jgi:hypothetical protein
MTVVTAAAVVAGVLDSKELEALVVLLTSSRHGCKFIAATTIERGGGTTFFARAPAATPATSAPLFTRAGLTGTAFARTAC